jgi:hypothetical protein
MATSTDTRSPFDPTPLFAVVGVTDLAVERVRAVQAQFEARLAAAQAGVEKQINDFDPQVLRAQAQDVPNKAAAFALTQASKASTKAESAYEDLARRGKSLVDRIRSQQATQDLVNQAGSTVSRGKAAVTVARKAADDTASAILGTLNVGKREADAVVQETEANVETAVRKTQTSAKKTATTTRKRAAATESAAKGAQTSARKTAGKASTATKQAAKKVGN